MALNLIAKAPVALLRFSQPRLATFMQYAKVELSPPNPAHIGAVSEQMGGAGFKRRMSLDCKLEQI